eukprot:gene11504-12699_t
MAGNNKKDFASLCKIAAEAISEIKSLDIERASSANNGGSRTAATSTVSSLAGELASRFPTYRSTQERSSNTGLGHTAVGRGRRTDRRGRRASSCSGERFQPYKAGRKPSGTVYRDLVIIPNPNTTKVPSHGSRLKLETRGLVVHEFPISRSWDANELRNQIQKHLPGDCCLFEYMKACYGTLVTPKLADGVQISDGPPTEKVLGVEVEIVTDGNINEQPNFSEHSIVGLQEFNSSAEVQIIDTAPVDYVFQDEAQMNEPIKCIRVHRASVREDMLGIFSDQRIMFAPLQVTLVNTFGKDEEGLGSDTLITDRIDITFTQSAGVGRVPVGHTCGFTLELPATYENLCAMREEFNNILSADNWEMNFV